MQSQQFPQRRLLNNRLAVPIIGFGGAPLGGLLKANDSEQSAAMLTAAWDSGLRFFDTAPFYGFGRSERMIGDLLRDRHGYLLSTKAGRLLHPGRMEHPQSQGWVDPLPFHPVFDYSYDAIMRSFEDSLQRLGMDRIDMLFVHDIGEMTHGKDNPRHMHQLGNGGYAALDALRSSGAVQAIGLGVNEIQVCRDALLMGKWDLFLLAGRYTLLEQHALDALLPACESSNTSIIIGGPYNSGILVGGDTWNYAKAPTSVIDKVQQLKDCAARHAIPLAAAALQFPLAHPAVVSVIPGLRNHQELAHTLQWAATAIPVQFWDELKDRQLLHQQAPTPTDNPIQVQP